MLGGAAVTGVLALDREDQVAGFVVGQRWQRWASASS